MKKNKLHLIFNPNSGQGKRRGTLDAIQKSLSEHYDLEVTISNSRKQARETARMVTLTQPSTLLVASGGDGTINDVLNGCDLSSPVTLGIIPTGTVNIVAREINIPLKIEDACECLKQRIERPVDVSVANKIRFLFATGIGFDAEIIENVDLKQKLILGKGVYALNSLKLMWSYKPFNVQVTVDGKNCYEGLSFEIIVGKSKNYAGKFMLFPSAEFDNGLLDVAVFAHKTKPSLMMGCTKFFLGSQDRKRLHFQGKTISVKTDANVPYHVDGDTGSSSPVEFYIEKQPVRLIVAQ
ncbi:MAG: diacylglycerol kinase family lipid kinase [Candidatus Auribacterota bacterium]|nr:diacylglycerol kinase family lipid kinase [Candidatus Auribacterota bacterium]